MCVYVWAKCKPPINFHYLTQHSTPLHSTPLPPDLPAFATREQLRATLVHFDFAAATHMGDEVESDDDDDGVYFTMEEEEEEEEVLVLEEEEDVLDVLFTSADDFVHDGW